MIPIGTKVIATTTDPHMIRAGKQVVHGTIFAAIHNHVGSIYAVRYGDADDWFDYSPNEIKVNA